MTQGIAGLDADAEFAGLFGAGVRIKVVGRALLEAIAIADFGADVDAHSGNSDADGKPGNDAESGGPGFFRFR